MTTRKPSENPTSTELLDKAKKALTPEQYQRMQDRAIEKIGIIKLSSMNLDGLKDELPAIIHGDPEEQDILSRLEVEFPWIKVQEEKSKTQEEKPKFTEHPWDWAKEKVQNGKEWAYETLVPDRIKKVGEMSEKWASAKSIATTVIAGVAAGEAIQSAEKAISWFDKLKNDPMKFFKELWEVITSGSWTKISAFFSSTVESLGITSNMAESFAGMLGIPKDTMKYAKKVFSLDIFGKTTYGDLSKVWGKYQKNPELDIMKELGIKEWTNTQVAQILESIFWKNSKDIASKFLEKSWSDINITKVSMSDFISKII